MCTCVLFSFYALLKDSIKVSRLARARFADCAPAQEVNFLDFIAEIGNVNRTSGRMATRLCRRHVSMTMLSCVRPRHTAGVHRGSTSTPLQPGPILAN